MTSRVTHLHYESNMAVHWTLLSGVSTAFLPFRFSNIFHSSCRRLSSVVAPYANKGYQGFGSFHSDNVEDLIRQAEDAYRPPSLPFEPLSIDACALPSPALNFGSREAKRLFQIDFARWTFVNHGAFGAAIIPVTAYAKVWRDYAEEQPLRFFDRVMLPHTVHVYRQLAHWIGGQPTDIAITQNVTTALNIIVRSESSKWGPGDEVLTLDIGYGAVKTLLKTVCAQRSATYRQVAIPLPLTASTSCSSETGNRGNDSVVGVSATSASNAVDSASLVADTERFNNNSAADEIEKLVVNALSDRTKFLLIDHVTSNTALVLPVQRIARACASRGIVVAVDGAHALLNLPINCREMQTSGVKYYVTNAHKWFCSPKGAAVMWMHPEFRDHVQPLVLSHGTHHGLTSAFIWDGCHDYSNILSLPWGMRMWETLGVERVRAYIHGLAARAAAMLSERWGTSILAPSLHASMALVKLPRHCYSYGNTSSSPMPFSSLPQDSTQAKVIQDYLYNQGIECPVKAIAGALYVRVSAHIYNNINDYEKLAYAIDHYRA